MMENRSAEQKETLVQMPKDSWRTSPEAGGPPAKRSLVWVAVMLTLMASVILALAAGLVYQVLDNRHTQIEPPVSDKVNITLTLQGLKTNESHEIVTMNRSGKYLVYGWIHMMGKEGMEIKQTLKGQTRNLITVKPTNNVTFFNDNAMLVNNNIISIRSLSEIKSLTVHVQEL